jgi:hypothetical protein
MNAEKAPKSQQPSSRPATLRAIVAVDEKDKVQCQQPGCGHSVYAAIHVVEEDGRLLVLGSTCFANRYGNANALGGAQYGAGSGRKLTEEERKMLLRNTEALLARFAREATATAQAHAARVEELRRKQAQLATTSNPGPGSRPPESHASAHHSSHPPSPWSWQRAWTSVALFTGPKGENWVRVQHEDGSQKLAPWPQFDGWETALPAGVGVADTSLGAIAVDNVVQAIQLLQGSGFRGPFVGSWQQVLPRSVSQALSPPRCASKGSASDSSYNAYAELKGRTSPRK